MKTMGPAAHERRARRRVLAAGAVSLMAWGGALLIPTHPAITWSEQMRRAAERTAAASAVLAEHAGQRGGIDPALDPNRTGLLGPDLAGLFTTLGSLDAKRTSTNPDFAGLLVYLLRKAGISAGDTVAVAASGSFPALAIASVAAAEELGAHPRVIISLGASSYGAVRPDWNLLDMYEVLLRRGLLGTAPVAVSLGGDDDAGREFEPEVRTELIARVQASGIPLLQPDGLPGAVSRRLELFGAHVSAFVNVGGSSAGLGTSPLVLEVPPGLNRQLELPPPAQRGVLYEFAARGVPVIHLLDLRALSTRHGLPWDPLPLPVPGTSRLRDPDMGLRPAFLLLTACYLAVLAVLGLAAWRDRDWTALSE